MSLFIFFCANTYRKYVLCVLAIYNMFTYIHFQLIYIFVYNLHIHTEGEKEKRKEMLKIRYKRNFLYNIDLLH